MPIFQAAGAVGMAGQQVQFQSRNPQQQKGPAKEPQKPAKNEKAGEYESDIPPPPSREAVGGDGVSGVARHRDALPTELQSQHPNGDAFKRQTSKQKGPPVTLALKLTLVWSASRSHHSGRASQEDLRC